MGLWTIGREISSSVKADADHCEAALTSRVARTLRRQRLEAALSHCDLNLILMIALIATVYSLALIIWIAMQPLSPFVGQPRKPSWHASMTSYPQLLRRKRGYKAC